MTALHPSSLDVECFVLGAFEEIAFPEIRAHFSICAPCASELQRQAAIELALEEAAAELEQGPKVIGGYAIESLLSRSPNGRVYAARDAAGRSIALKELRLKEATDLEAIKHFEREAKVLQQLHHPAIPRYVTSFTDENSDGLCFYLGHELIEGDTLAQIIARQRTNEREARAIARQVLDVLEYLHELSPPIYHRDIHPENIVRRPDGTIMLVNFGAARDFATTTSVTIAGKFGFVPVEQLAGVVDQTSDLYALGATLIHLLTQREPWTGDPKSLLRHASISADFRAFLEKLTSERMIDRFPSASAAQRALEQIDQPRARTRWAFAVIAAAGCAASAFIGVAAEKLSRPSVRVENVVAMTPGRALHPCVLEALGVHAPVACAVTEHVALYRDRHKRMLAVFDERLGPNIEGALPLPDHVTQAAIFGSRVFVVSPPSEVGIFDFNPKTGELDPNARWFDVPRERTPGSAIGGIATDHRDNVFVATRGPGAALYRFRPDGGEKIADLAQLEVRALSSSAGGDRLYAIGSGRLVELDFSGRMISALRLDAKPIEDSELVMANDMLMLVGAVLAPEAGLVPHRRECVFIDPEGGGLHAIVPCGPEGEAVFDQLYLEEPEAIAAVGTLQLNARPAAEIYLDGRLVGPTPIQRELPAGIHQLIIVAPDGEAYAREVSVSPGRKTTILHHFDESPVKTVASPVNRVDDLR